MAILAFQKPEKVIMLESTSSFGKFEFRPLEPGFGMTVGNALRRILLSSLEGYAITTVKVAGVDHEFAAIPGVMEDMLNIILSLKQVRFIRTVDNQDAEKVSINVAGVTELTAGYISNYLSFFKVLNPELVICHLAPGTKMQLTITIGKGRGYVPAEENAPAESEIGTLPIDSIFTPIKNVKYSIENYRVEQKTDYEKLNLEITTGLRPTGRSIPRRRSRRPPGFSFSTSCSSPTRKSPSTWRITTVPRNSTRTCSTCVSS